MHGSPDGDFEHEPLPDFRPSVDLPTSAQPVLIDMSRPQESATYSYMPTFGETKVAGNQPPVPSDAPEKTVDQSSARGGLSQQPVMQPHSDATDEGVASEAVSAELVPCSTRVAERQAADGFEQEESRLERVPERLRTPSDELPFNVQDLSAGTVSEVTDPVVKPDKVLDQKPVTVKEAALAFDAGLSLIQRRFDALKFPVQEKKEIVTQESEIAADQTVEGVKVQDQAIPGLHTAPSNELEKSATQEVAIPERHVVEVRKVSQPSEVAIKEQKEPAFPRTVEVFRGIAADLSREWGSHTDVRLAAEAYEKLVGMHEAVWKELGEVVGNGPVYCAQAEVDKAKHTESVTAAWRFDPINPGGDQDVTITVVMDRQLPEGTLPRQVRSAAQYLGRTPRIDLPFRDSSKLLGVEVDYSTKPYEFDKSKLAFRLSEKLVPYMKDAHIVFGWGVGSFARTVESIQPEERELLQDLQDARTAPDWMLGEAARKVTERAFASRKDSGALPEGLTPEGDSFHYCLKRCMRMDLNRVLLLDQVLSRLKRSNMAPHFFDPEMMYPKKSER